MYCPSCQTQVDVAGDACSACGWKFNTSPTTPANSIVRAATRPKIQCELDLAVTVDRTGSSERFQTGIPKTYEMIVTQVAAKAREVRCFVGSHGDLDEGQEFCLHTDAGTPEQAIEDVRKIVYGGGGPPEENHLDAIETILNSVPWTADPARARGTIIGFLTADTKPAKSGVSAAELGKQIKDRGILLYLVCEPTPTLQELADAAEGLVFQITNDPDPTEMAKIAMKLAESIVVSVAAGSTVPMTSEN